MSTPYTPDECHELLFNLRDCEVISQIVYDRFVVTLDMLNTSMADAKGRIERLDAVTKERGEIDARVDKATALLGAHVVSIEKHGSGYIDARMLVSHLLNILNGVTK